MISVQEIETGNFSPPRLVLIPPDSIRVVNWNINRGLRLQGVIEFLASAKADVVLLQESDLNARRTHHLNVAKLQQRCTKRCVHRIQSVDEAEGTIQLRTGNRELRTVLH